MRKRPRNVTLEMLRSQLGVSQKEEVRLRGACIGYEQRLDTAREEIAALKIKTEMTGNALRSAKTLTIVESPFLGGLPWAVAYARSALYDSLRRGESPFASHLLYPQVLDDHDPAARRAGIEAGLSLYGSAARGAVYVDFGVTSGMAEGIAAALQAGVAIEARSFGPKMRAAVMADPSKIYRDDSIQAAQVTWPLAWRLP